MSGKKNIQTIVNLGLVWGLEELRALLSAKPLLRDNVKIVFMKIENIQKQTMKRLVNSLASKINPNAHFEKDDPTSQKLDEIFREFDINPCYQDGILIACNGKGDINQTLQNNSVALTSAEQLVANLETDENNYVVYIDSDVRSSVMASLPQPPEDDDTEATDKLDRLESQEPSKIDPEERFTLLLASSKKLRSIIGNFTSVEGTASKARYLQQIDQNLDVHLRSLIRAEQSYYKLKDNQTADKIALERKLELVKSNKDALVEEMSQRETEYNIELANKDKKQKELEEELKKSLVLKTEKEKDGGEASEDVAKIRQLEEEINDLKDEIQSINDDFEKAKEASKTSIRDLEDEKAELAVDLDKKERALKRLELLHEQVQHEDSTVQQELEKTDLTPGKTLQRIVTTGTATHFITPLNKKMTLQDKTSLIKPRGLSFDDENVIHQIDNDSPMSYMGANGMIDKSSNTPTRTPSRSTSSRPIICKPTNFGLNTWNPLTTDIYVHLDKALKAGREALNVGATHTSVTRMILNSLGSNCDHVENFIEGAENMSLEKFAEAIGKILGKKSSVQMQSFLTAQRRSGEDLLAYFTRLQMLYRSSNKLTENYGWEEDPTHSMSFYSKIFDACYQSQKNELIRKTEEFLEKGNLTLPKLKSILVDVNKIDTSKLSAEGPVVAYVSDKPTYKNENFAQEKKNWYNENTNKNNEEKNNDVKRYDNKKKIVCWHCNTPGHTKLQCYKYIRKMKNEENKGYSRETKTHGSRNQENSQHQ